MEDKNCNTCAHRIGLETHVLPIECNECYSFKSFPNWEPIKSETYEEYIDRLDIPKVEEKKSCKNCMHDSGKMNSEYIKQHCYPCIQRSNWEPIKEESYIIKAFKPEVKREVAKDAIIDYRDGHKEPVTSDNLVHLDVVKEWKLDFDLGNVIKYVARADYKGNKLGDLYKAKTYLEHEIRELEKANV